MKKIISLLLALCMAFSFSSIAFASNNENSNVNTTDSAPILREINKPSVEWKWTSEPYKFQGNSSYLPLYSNYYFSNASKMRIIVNNKNSTKTLTVKLLESQGGVDWAVSEQKITPNDSSDWTVSNLDPSKNYILKFSAPCNFDGSIQKV